MHGKFETTDRMTSSFIIVGSFKCARPSGCQVLVSEHTHKNPPTGVSIHFTTIRFAQDNPFSDGKFLPHFGNRKHTEIRIGTHKRKLFDKCTRESCLNNSHSCQKGMSLTILMRKRLWNAWAMSIEHGYNLQHAWHSLTTSCAVGRRISWSIFDIFDVFVLALCMCAWHAIRANACVCFCVCVPECTYLLNHTSESRHITASRAFHSMRFNGM